VTLILILIRPISVPAAEPALTLHANAAAGADVPITIELVRWSTDAERAPLLAALAPAPAPAAAPAADALEPPGARVERGEGDGEAVVAVAQLRRIRSPG
jgi:hypothetical protein